MSQPHLSESEMVAVCHDRRTGVKAVIAVDDTTLGPGLGGVRWRSYPSEAAAVTEAQRLAAGMTLKHAVAGLPFGGAKSVIFGAATLDRAEVMRSFGAFVARLGGTYIPGVDMGTTTEDLAVVGSLAEVSCHEEDPSPATAIGVYHAIVAAADATFESGLSGRTVTIQGVGHVGSHLASLLAADGAKVLVADADPARAEAVATAVGGDVVAASDIVAEPCDVFAPCATARILDQDSIPRLGARIVAGAANDVLAHRDLARLLADRGVTYVPDFVANGGGVIHIQSRRAGWDAARLDSELAAIGTRVRSLLDGARERAVTPLEVAEELASSRVGRAVRLPA